MPGRGRKVASASAWFLHITADSGLELDKLWSCSGPHALDTGRCVRSRLALWEAGGGRAAFRGGASTVPAMGIRARRSLWSVQMEAGAEALAAWPRFWRKFEHLCSSLSEAHADPFILCNHAVFVLTDGMTSEGIISSRFGKRRGFRVGT